ncbi:immunoglobulin gamma-1 heavy chain-like [Chaetodon trifascialis]|uniref:immunoglobulin gamma-1 heavy chain-like n=1 Tax=Chaetodon trifascialis TaxID=109706 RepID=UPI0039966253
MFGSAVIKLLFSPGVSSKSLTESEPVVKELGESHKLTCTYVGISDDDSHISWIRQAQGKGLEWLGHISATGGHVRDYSRSVQNRFHISRNNNLDQVYLQMNSLTTEDSAVYYCARKQRMEMQHCDAFEQWGPGTEVTVSSATAVSPTLFPLVQWTSGPDDKITVGCLAHDFYPKSLTFQWTDASGTSLTSVQYPTAERNSKYTGVSLVQVSKSDWDSRKSFDCSVTHPGGQKSLKVQMAPIPPKITLVSVPNGDTQTLVCTIENVLLKELSVKWKKDANSVNDFSTWESSLTNSAVSVLKVEKTDWDNQAVYTCEVTHKEQTYTKKTSKAPITVTLNRPSPKDMFSSNQAKLECIVTGQSETDVNEIKIFWQIDGQKVTNNIAESTEGKIKTSTMTRSRTEWLRVNKVRCSAIRDDMTEVNQDLTVQPGDGRKPSVTVHILPEEVIKQGDSAEVTLVCLVSSPVQQDYYIAWSEHSGQKTGIYNDGINFLPQKTKNGYSVTSVYTTTKEKWNSWRFECIVWPAGSNDSTTVREVSKAQGNFPECDK